MTEKLNFDVANAGLDLIAHGTLLVGDALEIEARTHRLIERLLDQLDVMGRVATPSEDTFLRRAIDLYGQQDCEGAVADALRASFVGHMPIAFVVVEPDRSVDLRDALHAARSGLARDRRSGATNVDIAVPRPEGRTRRQ